MKRLVKIVLFLLIFTAGFFSRDVIFWFCVKHDQWLKNPKSCYSAMSIDLLYLRPGRRMVGSALRGNLNRHQLQALLSARRLVSPHYDGLPISLYLNAKGPMKLDLACYLAYKGYNVLGYLRENSKRSDLSQLERQRIFYWMLKLYDGDEVVNQLLEGARRRDPDSVFILARFTDDYFMAHPEDKELQNAINNCVGKKLNDYLQLAPALIKFWEKRTVQERNEILLGPPSVSYWHTRARRSLQY